MFPPSNKSPNGFANEAAMFGVQVIARISPQTAINGTRMAPPFRIAGTISRSSTPRTRPVTIHFPTRTAAPSRVPLSHRQAMTPARIIPNASSTNPRINAPVRSIVVALLRLYNESVKISSCNSETGHNGSPARPAAEITLVAIHEHSEQDTHRKGNTHGFIWMSADHLVGGAQGGGGLFFKPAATRLDAFQCVHDR